MKSSLSRMKTAGMLIPRPYKNRTWGNTREEALKHIDEAVQLVVESMIEHGEPLPEKSTEEVQITPTELHPRGHRCGKAMRPELEHNYLQFFARDDHRMSHRLFVHERKGKRHVLMEFRQARNIGTALSQDLAHFFWRFEKVIVLK